jgi:hypothetical protein
MNQKIKRTKIRRSERINIVNFHIAYICSPTDLLQDRDSSVGIATGFGLGGWGSIPTGARIFLLLSSVQTGSGAYPASYPMGTGGSFSGFKAAGG